MRPLLSAAILLGATCSSELAPAEPTKTDKPLKTPGIAHDSPPPGALVNVNVRDASLADAVKMVGEWTGRRFVFGGKLRKVSLNIISPKPVTVPEAYGAFLSALASHGLTVVPVGRYLKIVESQGAVSELTPIYGTAEKVPISERFVTRMYRLRHIDAAAAHQVLDRFKSKNADITVYPGSKLLIITDTGANIRRMLRLVEELDHHQVGEKIYIQPLLHTSATEIAALLNEMLRIDQDGARILADERNNQLVIVTSEEDYKQILALVRRVDLPARKGGQFRAIRLQHARCDEIEPALTKVTVPQPAPKGAPAAGEAGLFEGAVAAHCVEASNALMVVSSLRDFAQLQHIVSELDEPRRQVFIEAVIMDVKVKDHERLGLGLHGAGPATIFGEESLLWGGHNAAASVGPPSNLEALAFGVRGPDVPNSSALSPVPGVSIPAFGIALNALATDGDANLLATPHILATDNIESEINIGENIALTTNAPPIPTQFQALPGAPPIPTAQAPRRDVGIILKITPRINDADKVRLEIDQEFSSAAPEPQGTLGTVNVAKRSAKTTVVVDDQQTVVIGGLTREEVVNEASKIPVLGDIPVLGALFSSTSETSQKLNLLLVLTPHIIRDRGDLQRIFERKMQERQEFLDRYFVFDDSLPWEPPVDYSRTNGLLENIRQAQLRIDERRAAHADLAGEATPTHTPVAPVGLPSIAGTGKAAAQPPRPSKPKSRPSRSKRRSRPRRARVPGSTPKRFRIE
jgi:general secretion pathway protein D